MVNQRQSWIKQFNIDIIYDEIGEKVLKKGLRIKNALETAISGL